VIGAGLAGCEAAWQAASQGRSVVLHEMKPVRFSPAHISPGLAELVCSNSLRSNSLENAAGVLKEELRRCGSLVMRAADAAAVPAGSALAVDRDVFSGSVTAAVEAHPRIRLVREEVCALPEEGIVIVATGPLTSGEFARHLQLALGKEFLFFHDAIAPIIEADSIDMSKTFRASRYGKGTADYINCPLSEEEYHAFVEQLVKAEKTPLRDFETLVPFEGCMPVEVMAERGPETLSFGPMKPVGLVDPRTGRQPYAALQLRQENLSGTLYNMVGFQTRMKRREQRRVFGMIAGLEHAEFARYGSLHRNTFICAPELLTETLQLQRDPRVFYAGQITGVEGYVESVAMGLVAGVQAARLAAGKPLHTLPPTTMTGALIEHCTGRFSPHFQPMNVNFGIVAPLPGRVPKKERKAALGVRALADIERWRETVAAAEGG
jgi:methylenetetrahydrofolate--tRNA-(uracil-5-)-methyltransferase